VTTVRIELGTLAKLIYYVNPLIIYRRRKEGRKINT
jgi:hypothetical protein